MLSRDDILNVSDRIIEKVEVPEWGGFVFVKSLNGSERDKWQASNMDKNKNWKIEKATSKLVVMCVCDEEGKQLFEYADIDILEKKSAKALNRVTDVALRLCGLTHEDVEEMEKNSESIPTDSSTLS